MLFCSGLKLFKRNILKNVNVFQNNECLMLNRLPFLYAYQWPLLKCSSERRTWPLKMHHIQSNNPTAAESRWPRNGQLLRTRQSKYLKRFLVETHTSAFSYHGYRYKTVLDLLWTNYHFRLLCMREDIIIYTPRVNI